MSTWTTLLRVCRSQLGDPHGMRWTTDDLVDYFVEAQERACRDGFLLRLPDSVTLTADTAEYAYPSTAIEILRVSWGGNTVPMQRRSVTDMDRRKPGWDLAGATGGPTHYIVGKETKKFSVWPTPTSTEVATSATLTLTIAAMPSTTPTVSTFEDNSTEPEIEAENHFELIDFVKYRCHLQDTQADGEKKAASDIAIFGANMKRAKAEALRQRGVVSTAFPGSRANL